MRTRWNLGTPGQKLQVRGGEAHRTQVGTPVIVLEAVGGFRLIGTLVVRVEDPIPIVVRIGAAVEIHVTVEVLRLVRTTVILIGNPAAGAGLSIAAVIYNTMNERRREIAIMRSLGARRTQIFGIIVLEAGLLSFLGAAIGVVVCHLAAYGLGAVVEDRTGVYLDWLQFGAWEILLVFGVTGIGATAGLIPAVKGSRTQVADNIAQNY